MNFEDTEMDYELSFDELEQKYGKLTFNEEHNDWTDEDGFVRRMEENELSQGQLDTRNNLNDKEFRTYLIQLISSKTLDYYFETDIIHLALRDYMTINLTNFDELQVEFPGETIESIKRQLAMILDKIKPWFLVDDSIA